MFISFSKSVCSISESVSSISDIVYSISDSVYSISESETCESVSSISKSVYSISESVSSISDSVLFYFIFSGLADCFSDILAGGGCEKCLLYVANVLYCKWRPLLFCMQQSGDKENIRLYLYKYTTLFTCIQG